MEVVETIHFWLWGSRTYPWQSPVNSSNPCLRACVCFKNNPTEGSPRPSIWLKNGEDSHKKPQSFPPASHRALGDGERSFPPLPTQLCFLAALSPMQGGGDAFHQFFLTRGRNVSLLMELTAAGRVFRLVVEEHTCNEWSNWINADNLMWKMHNQLALEGWLVLFSLSLALG